MTSFVQLARVLVAQADTPPPAGGGFGMMVPMLLMFGVIYLLLIRPANKQRRQHGDMLNKLQKNDEVATTGGIYGKIITIDEKVVTLEVADKVKIRILRDRISGKWDPGQAAPSK